MARAASMNSLSRIDRMEERIIRAYRGTQDMATATMMFTIPVPRAAITAIARRMEGRLRKMSMILINTLSSLPP